MSFRSEKVALPEYSAKQLVWVAWKVACFEEDGGFLLWRSSGGSAGHWGVTCVRGNLVLPLILMLALQSRVRWVTRSG